MAAILVVSTSPQNQPGHHAPGFVTSDFRRIIADVHGVPDFLDQPEILQVMHQREPHL